MRLIALRKIHGNSLSPLLSSGDFVVTSSLYWSLKVGDIVVVQHPVYRRIIKKVLHIAPDHSIQLTGENTGSITTEQMGWIDSQWIEGKVYFCIRAC